MKLFSSTQISWSEPWFFLLRIREAWGWRRRLLLAIGISVLMFLAIYFFGNARLGLLGAVGMGLVCGFVFMVVIDIVNIQREVTVHDDRIIVGSVGAHRFQTFKFDAIAGVRLMRPAEWNKPWGAMIIDLGGDDGFLLAVPNKLSLDTLADIFHRLGVTVALPGWVASESDTRIGTFDQLELDPAAAQGQVSIQPIEDQEPPLISTTQIIVRELIGAGPFLLSLIAAIAVGVFLFLHWSDTSIVGRCLYIGGALVAIVVTFVYMLMVGQFLSAAYSIRVKRANLRTRPNATFGSTDEDLIYVEIFDRESWTKIISMSADSGFLKIDRQQSRFQFEGKKFRWSLPISALTACRIEESIVGSEADENAERRYFVVIEAAKGNEAWEAGMIYTRTEMGNDNAESRYKRAQLLFTQIAEAV